MRYKETKLRDNNQIRRKGQLDIPWPDLHPGLGNAIQHWVLATEKAPIKKNKAR